MHFSETRVCPGKKICNSCFMYQLKGGYCPGCNGYYHRCKKNFCNFQCNNCSGGKKAQGKTQGCCGRLNLLEKPLGLNYRSILSEQIFTESNSGRIRSNSIFIPIIKRDIIKYHVPEKFPEINIWSVPLKHIFNRSGNFKTNDVKDYLGLSANNKLILSTYSPDNFQEKLWEKIDEIDFRKYNIDYWFPAHFSIYDNDSKLYQFVSAKRQQIHANKTNSQFRWFRLSDSIPVNFLNLSRAYPSILISTDIRHKISIRILQSELNIADKYFDPDVDFYFIGGISSISNQLPLKRNIFIINGNWMIKALKRKDIYDNSYTEYSYNDTDAMLVNNLKEELKNAEKYRI